MDSINIPVLLLIVACIGVVRLLVSLDTIKLRGDGLPPPDLRACERGGSVEYFIRASRGVNLD